MNYRKILEKALSAHTVGDAAVVQKEIESAVGGRYERPLLDGWNNLGVITVITLLSFTLTFARAYSGSILPPFIIHLVFNGIQALVLALTPFIDSNLLEKGEKVTPTTPGLELAGHLISYLCRMT